ncbi:MAG: hypothetical protein R3F59_21065 [Myxococcota bacterium]
MSARIVQLRYPTASEVTSSPTASVVRLALDSARAEVGLSGRVKDRRCCATRCCAVELRDSDLRYRGRDHTAYLAYLMKQGKKASAAIWEAQKAFLDMQYGETRGGARRLDPISPSTPTRSPFEVFSRDESAWARLAFDNDAFEDRTAATGTAACDLSKPLVDRLLRVRTYQPLQLDVGTSLGGAAEDREVELPDDWLRELLRVQSAATLPAAVAGLRPSTCTTSCSRCGRGGRRRRRARCASSSSPTRGRRW